MLHNLGYQNDDDTDQLRLADKPAIPDKTAAGIFTYAMIDGKPHALLSQRVRHTWWDNFGGKSDDEDSNLLQTAIREVTEESNGLLQYTEEDLKQCPFHDLISKKPDGSPFTYRMYLVEHAKIDTSKLHDYEHTRHDWIPIDGLLQALKQKPVIVEREETCEIPLAGKQEAVPVYAPLYRMLQQAPVLENLQRLVNNQRLNPTHTYGYVVSQKNKQSDYDTLSPALFAGKITKERFSTEAPKFTN